MKKDWVEIERKLTAMAMDEQGYDDDQLDALHEKARQRLMASMETPVEQQAKKKSLGRRLLIAAGAALALMVLSVVYTMAFPVEVGKANNFAKRMTIWVNGMLGREYVVEVPFEDEAMVIDTTSATCDSVAEVAASIEYPLCVINEAETGYVLEKAEVTNSEYDRLIVNLEYSKQEKKIWITNQYCGYDEAVLTLNDTMIVKTGYGDVYVWQNEEYSRGMLLQNDGIIQIKMNTDIETLKSLLSHIELID